MQAGANWNNGVNGVPVPSPEQLPVELNTNIGSRLPVRIDTNHPTRHYGAGRSDRWADQYSLPYGRTMVAPRLRAGRSFFIKEAFLVFERVYDYRNLYEAYIKARKQKRYRGEVLQFSYALEENLIGLQNELVWKTYKVGVYRPFVIYEPKKRQIVALPFRDRVVQHALNAVIEPIFERRMIYDSYACRGARERIRRPASGIFPGKPGITTI